MKSRYKRYFLIFITIAVLSSSPFLSAYADDEQSQSNDKTTGISDAANIPGSNTIEGQDCTIKNNIIPASTILEEEIVKCAEKNLGAFLKTIEQGEKKSFGIGIHDGLKEATVGNKPYQMYVRCESYDNPTNLWRVPVLVHSQVRAFMTVEWIGNGWQAVAFGATQLAEKVSALDVKTIEKNHFNEDMNLHRMIIRDYKNLKDYLLIRPYPEGKEAILAFPEVIQEQPQWCWVGVSAAIFEYFDSSVEQCEIAEYTRTVATWHNFGSENCCTDASAGCNYWNYNWGRAGSIENILESMQKRINIQNYGISRKLTIIEVEDDLSQDKPFVIRWGWDSGGGHFLVGFGLDGIFLHYMDPWFGEGDSIGIYDWVCLGGGHTWTHTNRVTDVFMYGDIDGSKHINMTDLILSLQLLTGMDGFT